MRVYMLSDRQSKKQIACIYGLRSEGVKILNKLQQYKDIFKWQNQNTYIMCKLYRLQID